MPKCIVKGCQHSCGRKNSMPGVILHMFPNDLTSIKRWLQQTNQDFGDLDFFAHGILQGKAGVARMCSTHFAPECYTLVGSEKVLLEGSIPTIFPERDKQPNRMQTAATAAFQNVYLPVNLWTNNMSVVSNVAPWGGNQVTSGLGVNVSTSAAGHMPLNYCITSPLSSFQNVNTHANLPGSLPRRRYTKTKKVHKAVQWPEYENNMSGEVWKIFHDHFYKVPYGSKYPGPKQCSPVMDDMSRDGFGSYCEGSHLENELFSMLQYVTAVLAVNKYRNLKRSRIFKQALEIVSLIVGEEWVIVNKNSMHQSVHQLTGEIPIKCDDLAVFFTKDEWSYIEEHKEDYRDLVGDSLPINDTWNDPQHWEPDPIIEVEEEIEEEEEEQIGEEEQMEQEEEEDFEEDDINDFPKKEETSSDWEPDSDVESEEDSAEIPEKLSSDEQPIMPHKCDQCEEAFPEEEALKTHKLTHIEKCEDCEEEFTTKADLIKHRAENHAVKRYACTICGIEYDYKSQFVIHQRAHTGEKPFECEECGKTFGFRSSLLVHQRRHVDGKPFKCSKCDRRFDKKSERVKHEKIHDVKKRHKCKKCGKAFALKSALERHKWDHDDMLIEKSEKKQYKCKKCNKSFKLKSAYAKHMYDHQADD